MPRSRFIPEEDELLKRLVGGLGCYNWQLIGAFFPDRNVRQVRDRWNHYLAPASRPVAEAQVSIARQTNSIVPGVPEGSAAEMEDPGGVIYSQTDGGTDPLSAPPLSLYGNPRAQEKSQRCHEDDAELSFDESFSRRLEIDNEMLWLD
jgi:hypothetical protein